RSGEVVNHFVALSWCDPSSPTAQNTAELLPFGPVWPGSAINTIFYAAVLVGGWLLFVAPFKLRRWRRIKRGHCVKCNYDLTGAAHERCPECGAAIDRRNVGTEA